MALAAAIPASAERLFGEVARGGDVTAIYISKAALKVADMSEAFSVHGKDYSRFINDLEGMEIIQCYDKKAIPDVMKQCRGIIKSAERNMLVEIIDAAADVALYARMIDEEGYASDMLLEVNESGEYTVVYFVGKIDVKGVIATMQE